MGIGSKLAAVAAFLFGMPALAQGTAEANYPSRPVTVVVPFAAGGPADLVGRAVTTRMSAALGQPFVIDNKGGAGGAIGSALAAKAQPNGYTLVIANPGSHGTAPLIQRDVAYDPVADFSPIALLGSATFVLVCNPALPPRTTQELIAYLKANPGKVRYGSAGIGSNVHFVGEYFKQRTGTDMQHVPYRGAGPMMNDLLAGTIDCTFDSSAKPHIDAGRLRAFAVTSAARDPLYPDVPTLQEAGIPDFNITSWQALLGPRDLPTPLVRQLNQAANDALRQREVADQLAGIGFRAGSGTPQDMQKLLERDRDLYREISRSAKIELQ
ncbi:MAG: tripartite tricarboxylate transporter substrate binding protein [Rhodospirillales bacterium]|nr:tripartite tricarboxylate transporter substrate binding protein [Rhodospirillales bacterium]